MSVGATLWVAPTPREKISLNRIPLALLGLALLAPTLHADDPAAPTPSVFRIEIVRVTARRDLFPLAFPTPSRVNGVMDELAVLEQNIAKDHVKATLTRFPAVTTPAGVKAVIVTGPETPALPAGDKHSPPVYRNRIIATPHVNPDGSISVPCRMMDTHPNPDFGSVVGEPPTIKNEVVSRLHVQSGDTQFVEAGDEPDGHFHVYYATVTVVSPAKD